MASTLIAHITDIHLPPFPDNSKPGNIKQFLGYLSWNKKRKYTHSEHVLKLLKDDLQTQNCDHFCVTGDQTNLGTEQEFKNASMWLQGLDASDKISVVPGNHDAYGKNYIELEKIYWSPWMLDKTSSQVGLPFVRRAGNVALIGVSSAVKTAPFMADGRIIPAQYKAMEDMMACFEDHQDYYKIVMIHHPPLSGVTSWRRGLHGVKKFQEFLKKHDINMVLYGHLHRPLFHKMSYQNKDLLFLGAGSASSNGHKMRPAQYYLIQVDDSRGPKKVDIRSRAYNPDKDMFEEVDLPTVKMVS